ncbi:MAG: AI-2E family transporter [Candidatus Gastranaerophilales bacterium]|nr:AI-2E family transporter [Candidatus Gastranaerophilales bacterium]
MFWNKNENLKNILFVMLIVFLIWFIAQIKDTALLAFASFVLACSLTPAVDWITSKFKHISRALAASIVIIAAILIVILFFIPIVTISIREIQQLVTSIPDMVRSLIDFVNNKTILDKTLIEYINLDSLTSTSSQVASGLVDKSINITKAIMEALTVLVTMGIIVFYMVYEKHLIRDAVLIMFPPKLKSRAKEVYEAIEKKVGGYVIAQVLSMTTVAIITALGLMILHVKYAMLLGLIAGILDIVPIVGPVIAFILGILCASPQGIIIVILTAIVYLAAQWISNNFIRPLVFGKFLDLHPIIIIFAFLIAAQFLGVWGVIISPAIAALLLTLFDELYLKTINSKIKEKEKEVE